jgi:hypothetical protein
VRVKYPLPVALRLQALHRQLNAQMKIKITEPVFFLHEDRKPGDVLDNVKTGPFRSRIIPGGLELTPQFVEMAEEIKATIADAVAHTEVGDISTVLAPATPMPAPAVRRPAVQVLPPIQIRGLAADVMTVKRGFSEIREVVRDVNLVSAALKQDLHAVKDQLHQHREDIRFEAETLGNNGGDQN